MSVCSGVLFVGRGAIDNFVFVVAFLRSFYLLLRRWFLFLFAVAPLIPLFFVPSLVSFSLLLGALDLLYAVTPLNSFRLSL